MKWERRKCAAKVWVSEHGHVIQGLWVVMPGYPREDFFFLFESMAHFDRGENFAREETLKEAKARFESPPRKVKTV